MYFKLVSDSKHFTVTLLFIGTINCDLCLGAAVACETSGEDTWELAARG